MFSSVDELHMLQARMQLTSPAVILQLLDAQVPGC